MINQFVAISACPTVTDIKSYPYISTLSGFHIISVIFVPRLLWQLSLIVSVLDDMLCTCIKWWVIRAIYCRHFLQDFGHCRGVVDLHSLCVVYQTVHWHLFSFQVCFHIKILSGGKSFFWTLSLYEQYTVKSVRLNAPSVLM